MNNTVQQGSKSIKSENITKYIIQMLRASKKDVWLYVAKNLSFTQILYRWIFLVYIVTNTLKISTISVLVSQ